MSTPSNPPLLEGAPDDVEDALVAYFTPMRRSSNTWETGDALPFTLIYAISGTEEPEVGIADPVVQIDTLVDKSLGPVNARNEARATHRAMLYLAFYQPLLNLNGRMFGVDYVKVVESPTWKPFGITTVLRKVGRYQIGLQYVPMDGLP